MGRKADTPDVKRAKGNPGRRAIAPTPVSAETTAPKGLQEMPHWVDTVAMVKKKRPTTQKARAEHMTALTRGIYEFIAPQLLNMNLLKSVDQPALAIYSRAFAEYINAIVELDRDGSTYKTTSPHSGTIYRYHPAARIRKEALSTIERMSDSLGITPMARYKLFQHLASSGNGVIPNDPINDDEKVATAGGDDLLNIDSPIGILGTAH